MNILEEIIENKKGEVARRKELYPLPLLKESIHYTAPTVSLKEYLLRPDKNGIIAEFKRRSPSKGNINKYAKVEEVTLGYMSGGASALSVLTDADYFGGSNKDLSEARKYNYCPVLRKDFVVDSYQLKEARSIGADAILLIANALEKSHLDELAQEATELGLEVLFEIHSAKELEKTPGSEVIFGINNRNLETFEVSLQNSIDLLPLLPNSAVKVAESGIHSAQDVMLLKSHGFNGFLIGERFMKTPNPGKSCRLFIDEINALKQKQNA